MGKSIAHLFLVILKLSLFAPIAVVGLFSFIIGISLWTISMAIIWSWTGSIFITLVTGFIIYIFTCFYICPYIDPTRELLFNALLACQDIDKDVDKYIALGWWKKSAELGNVTAQYQLGYAYYKGDGAPINSTEAARWFTKSAEQGNIQAQVSLADIYSANYFKDSEMQQNYSEAAKWYKEAAKQGDAKAQYKLGYIIYEGKGVTQDYKEAAKWWGKSAEQNYAPAQCDLGILAYFQGNGVPKDFILAHKWLR